MMRVMVMIGARPRQEVGVVKQEIVKMGRAVGGAKAVVGGTVRQCEILQWAIDLEMM